MLTPGGWFYDVIYVALIIFFTYFYTAVTFNPVDVADNLKKYGGFIPGDPARTATPPNTSTGCCRESRWAVRFT